VRHLFVEARLAVQACVGGAVNPERSGGQGTVRDERIRRKVGAANLAERAGVPELPVAPYFAGENHAAAIVDDDQFERRRKLTSFRVPNQTRHFGNQADDDGLVAYGRKRFLAWGHDIQPG
jgi:hypothetical protein